MIVKELFLQHAVLHESVTKLSGARQCPSAAARRSQGSCPRLQAILQVPKGLEIFCAVPGAVTSPALQKEEAGLAVAFELSVRVP